MSGTSIIGSIDQFTSAVAGEVVKSVTVLDALDHMADALAGEDVQLGPSAAGSFSNLAKKVEDGEITIGGGGVQLGNCAKVAWAATLPQSVQDMQTVTFEEFSIVETYVDNSLVCSGYYDPSGAPCVYADGAQVHAQADGVYSDTASVSAVIFWAEPSDDASVDHFDVYTGVTFDSETNEYVIPLHDIPAPLTYEGDVVYPTIFCKNDAD